MLIGVYETTSGTRSLKYIVTPFGRAVKNGSAWVYEYNLTDHLGNVRVVIKKGANNLAEVVQQKGYYSFGMEISQFSSGTGTSKNWYNGKEIQEDFGLYWYDYGARFYDPQLGRFHSIDPKSERFSYNSPYVYSVNNPIRFIDLNGESPWEPNGDGTWTAEKGDGAETLARDAGISKEKAYKLLEEQRHGTYVDKSDGVTKSAVDPGDVVDVNSMEVTETKNEISVNEEKIDVNSGKIDSLKKESNRKSDLSEAAFNTAKEAATDGPNQAGSRLGYGMLSNKFRKESDIDKKHAESLSKQNDSLNTVNNSLKKKLK